MNINKTPAGFHPIEHGFPLIVQAEDNYRTKAKLQEPTSCKQCGALYQKGRWQWGQTPEGAHHETCPACHRINDNLPAGWIILEGDFFEKHRDEILRLAQHLEARERAEHPLKRIMTIEKQDAATVITTTDLHLAHGIAKAIHDAYQGDLQLHYNAGEHQLRGHWQR